MTHDLNASLIASLRAMVKATECNERALPPGERLAAVRPVAIGAWLVGAQKLSGANPLVSALDGMLSATQRDRVDLALIVPARQLALAALADAGGAPSHKPQPPVPAPPSLLEAARTYLHAPTHANEAPLYDAIEREDQAQHLPSDMGNLPPAQHAVAAAYETHWSDVIARYPDAEASEPGLTPGEWARRHEFIAPAA